VGWANRGPATHRGASRTGCTRCQRAPSGVRHDLKHDHSINVADPVLTVAVRVAPVQQGMDPLGVALAGRAQARAPAKGLADWSDRDRSHVWELA
jgi:hypothetical protein